MKKRYDGYLVVSDIIGHTEYQGKVIHTKPIEIPDSEVSNAVEKSLDS